MRGVLSIFAIIGFTYNGWVVGTATGVATLAASLVAGALAYGAGRLRMVQIQAEAENRGEESEAPAAGDDADE